MSFLLAIALLIVLPHPWNWFAFAGCLVVGIGEVSLWNRTVKHRRAATGAETLIGKKGKVLSRLAPEGQIELSGEIWRARCAAAAEVGQAVTVVDRDGLTLIVEPVGADAAEGRGNNTRVNSPM